MTLKDRITAGLLKDRIAAGICPVCDSDEVDGHRLSTDDDGLAKEAHQDGSCVCGCRWVLRASLRWYELEVTHLPWDKDYDLDEIQYPKRHKRVDGAGLAGEVQPGKCWPL